MAIKYIDQITIDGAGSSPNRKLFNGYIYNLTYKIGVAGDRSEVTANLFSEDGEYSIQKGDINWNKIYQINIGKNLVFNGYLVRYKLDKSTRKTLELKFVDTSVKLDQYFVGLKNKHGKKSQGNIIIVGREFHPCDRDYDGDIDSIPDIRDECHPCRNQADRDAKQDRLINCRDLNYNKIFPVQYNFTQLIEKLRDKFNIQLTLKDPNTKYYKDTTGSVREVLESWCSDFGWTFYWENETIKFLDLRKTIDVKAKLSNYAPNVSAISEEYSVEESFDRIVASYYERGGTRDEYKCEDAMHFSIPVLVPNRVDLGAELQITDRIPEVAAGLIQYSEALRDLWYWYDHYSLRSPEDYYYGRKLHKVGLEILSNPIMLDGSNPVGSGGLDAASGLSTASLEPSTGLGKPDGMPSNPDPSSTLEFLLSSPPTPALLNVKAMILNNPKYKMCFELLKPEDQWVVANGLTRNKDDYFFFVGYYDEGLHNEHKQNEGNYGAEFLNKYHVLLPNTNNPIEKKFFEDQTFPEEDACGVKIRTNDAKITYDFLGNGGDGNVEFFNTPANAAKGDIKNLSDLPFHKWLKIFTDADGQPDSEPEQITKLAEKRAAMFKAIVVQKSNASFYPSPQTRTTGDPEEDRPKNEIKDPKLISLAAKNSLVIVQERNNQLGEFVPRKLLELTNTPLDRSIDRSHVYIMAGRVVKESEYRVVTNNAINPSAPLRNLFDGKPEKKEFNDEDGTDGETFYKYGDLKCLPLGNILPFCRKRNFKTPVGVFSYYEPTYSDYGVVLEKTKNIKHAIQKLEMPIWDRLNIKKNVGRLDVKQINISDEEIRIFKNEQNSCRYDKKKIRDYHDLQSKHLAATVDKPLEAMQITIEGIDLATKPTIGDGLIGVDISMTDDGGITSTYSLGTTLFKIPNIDVIRLMDEATRRKSVFGIEPPAPHKQDT